MNAALVVVLAFAAVCSGTVYQYGAVNYPSVQYNAGYTGYPVVGQQVYSAASVQPSVYQYQPSVYQQYQPSVYTAAKVQTVGQQYYAAAAPQYTYASVPAVGSQYLYNVAK